MKGKNNVKCFWKIRECRIARLQLASSLDLPCSALGKGWSCGLLGFSNSPWPGGNQEAARKDGACGEGSAQMQVRSGRSSFHPTELFNKGSGCWKGIFCKKEAKGRGGQTSLGTQDFQSRLTKCGRVGEGEPLLKGTDATMGQRWDLPQF